MATAAAAEAIDAAEGKGGGGRKKLILIVLPLLLAGIGAGLWFSGILPKLLGMGAHDAAAGHGEQPQAEAPRPPVFFEMPDIITNLNASGRRPVYVKLRSKLEITRAEDAAAIQTAMPRLLDLFQTHLREMRPEELRGSAGTQRLREELIARANIAVAPPPGSTQPAPRVTDVLFLEMLVQ
ncbi:flagellar basal body-associated FliL family protein [Roseomonas sp. HJA6]|uniref:Flagellar protein FliL n=1 Tax=Roseomonas alba TaxID=2846776 RepID=A0ABS7A4T5_9PROT|nr:flagellar basal body-associated FliL family protein [Neoroseomonas alba]MBW6397288.1 flagellar basal body-associated FliL family protein [Neoroseomonas alba]